VNQDLPDQGAAPLQVLFLVPRLDKASTRYRVLQYFPALEEAGIRHEIRALSKTARNRLQLIRQVRAADVVFIQKKLFSTLEIALLRRLSKRLVYDFDDSVMYKDGPASERQHARQRRRFAATAARADLLIAGNDYLCEEARACHRPTVMIPTPLDMTRYTSKAPENDAKRDVVLGWIGSRGTLRYLKEIAPALETLGERLPGVKLKIVADDFFDLEHLPVIKKNWSATDEIADLHSFDIGLMPLTDDVWTRGKCGFKLLQCMAVGLPVVCSPVGANRQIVTDGVEGYWASSHTEWVEKITALVTDTDLARTMGRHGREKVLQTYSLQANVPLLIQALRLPDGCSHEL
jgi:glycosyltransferase involved in cell wall biosynthesis